MARLSGDHNVSESLVISSSDEEDEADNVKDNQNPNASVRKEHHGIPADFMCLIRTLRKYLEEKDDRRCNILGLMYRKASKELISSEKFKSFIKDVMREIESGKTDRAHVLLLLTAMCQTLAVGEIMWSPAHPDRTKTSNRSGKSSLQPEARKQCNAVKALLFNDSPPPVPKGKNENKAMENSEAAKVKDKAEKKTGKGARQSFSNNIHNDKNKSKNSSKESSSVSSETKSHEKSDKKDGKSNKRNTNSKNNKNQVDLISSSPEHVPDPFITDLSSEANTILPVVIPSPEEQTEAAALSPTDTSNVIVLGDFDIDLIDNEEDGNLDDLDNTDKSFAVPSPKPELETAISSVSLDDKVDEKENSLDKNVASDLSKDKSSNKGIKEALPIDRLSSPVEEKEKTSAKKSKKCDNSAKNTSKVDNAVNSKTPKVKESPLGSTILSPNSRRSTFLKAVEKVKEDTKADRRPLTVEIFAPPDKPKEKKTASGKGPGRKKKSEINGKGSRTSSENSSDDEVVFVSETPSVTPSTTPIITTTQASHTVQPDKTIPSPNLVHSRTIPCPDMPWNDTSRSNTPGSNLLDMCYVYEITPNGKKIPSSLVSNKNAQPSILSTRDNPTEFIVGRDGKIIEPSPGTKTVEKRKYTSEKYNPGPVKSPPNVMEKPNNVCTHQKAYKPCRNIVLPGKNVIVPGNVQLTNHNVTRVVTKPSNASPVQKSSNASPVQKPTNALPALKPINSSFVQKSTNASPVQISTNISLVQKPTHPSVQKSMNASPAQKSTNASLVQKTTNASPVQKSRNASPAQAGPKVKDRQVLPSTGILGNIPGKTVSPNVTNVGGKDKRRVQNMSRIIKKIKSKKPADVTVITDSSSDESDKEDVTQDTSNLCGDKEDASNTGVENMATVEYPAVSSGDEFVPNKNDSQDKSSRLETNETSVSNENVETVSESSGDEVTILANQSSPDNEENSPSPGGNEYNQNVSNENAENVSESSGDEVTVVPSPNTCCNEEIDVQSPDTCDHNKEGSSAPRFETDMTMETDTGVTDKCNKEKSSLSDHKGTVGNVPETDEVNANLKSPSESSGDDVTLISDSDQEKEEGEKKEEESESDGKATVTQGSMDTLAEEKTADCEDSEANENEITDNKDEEDECSEDASKLQPETSTEADVSDSATKSDDESAESTKSNKKRSIQDIANKLKKIVEEKEEDEIKIIDPPNNSDTAAVSRDNESQTIGLCHAATPVSSSQVTSIEQTKTCIHHQANENNSDGVILIGDDSDEEEPEKVLTQNCEPSSTTDKPITSTCKESTESHQQCNKEPAVSSKPSLTTKKTPAINSKSSLESSEMPAVCKQPSLTNCMVSVTPISPSAVNNENKSSKPRNCKNKPTSSATTVTTILSKPILSKPILSKSILSKPILNKPILNKPILSKPILSKPILSKPSPGSKQLVKKKLSATKTDDTTTYVSNVLSNNSTNADGSSSIRILSKASPKSDTPPDIKTATSSDGNSVPQSPQGHKVLNLSSKESKIRHLETILERLERKINRYARQELSFKEMASEDSAYLQEARAKERYLYNWRLYCKLTGEDPDLVVSARKKVKVTSSPFPHLNAVVEKYINRTDIFPNLFEVKQVCTQANIKYNLELKDNELHHCAVDIFSEVGRKLQKRREKEFRTTSGNVLTDQVKYEDDPARQDLDLKQKLKHNKKIARQKTDHVFKDFVRQQYEQITGDVDDSNDSNNDSDREPHIRGKVLRQANYVSHSDNEERKSESDVQDKGSDSDTQEKDSDPDSQEKSSDSDSDSQEKDSDGEDNSQDKDSDSDEQDKNSDSDTPEKNIDIGPADKDSDSDGDLTVKQIRKEKRRLSENNNGTQVVKKKRVDKTVISLTLSSSQEIAEQSGNKKIDYQVTIGSVSPKLKSTQGKSSESRTKSPVSTQVTQKQASQKMALLQSKSKHLKSKPTVKRTLPSEISTETPESVRLKEKIKSGGDTDKSGALNSGKRKRISMMNMNDSRVVYSNSTVSKSVGNESKKTKTDAKSFRPFSIKKKVCPSLIPEKHVLGTGEKNDRGQYIVLSRDVTSKRKDKTSVNKENSKLNQVGETIILDDD